MIDPETLFPFQFQPKPLDARRCILTWLVPEDLPYFDGHFPKNPIFPAVAVLDGTLEALKLVLKDKTLSFARIRSAKFLNIITPGTPLQICLARIEGNEWEVEWRLPGGNKVFAHLKLSLRSGRN